VKVEEQTRGVLIGDAGGLQVDAEHLRSLLGQREHRRRGLERGHEGGQIGGYVVREGQRDGLTVLGIGGLYGNAGGLPVE
jgi:hypothetical protein